MEFCWNGPWQCWSKHIQPYASHAYIRARARMKSRPGGNPCASVFLLSNFGFFATSQRWSWHCGEELKNRGSEWVTKRGPENYPERFWGLPKNCLILVPLDDLWKTNQDKSWLKIIRSDPIHPIWTRLVTSIPAVCAAAQWVKGLVWIFLFPSHKKWGKMV